MPLGYSLALALLLLFPGLCAYVGMRYGAETDVVTPRPEKPNSTATLAVVITGSLIAHVAGAGYFGLQKQFCASHRCIPLDGDPNVYRDLLGGAGLATPSDLAIEVFWLYFLMLGLATGWVATKIARRSSLHGATDRIDFGWLYPAVRAVKVERAVILAYVLTKTSHDGVTLAFEGIVDRLSLDENDLVTMIVLRRVDRFSVRINPDGEMSHQTNTGRTIGQIQFGGAEIANIAFEVLVDPGGGPGGNKSSTAASSS